MASTGKSKISIYAPNETTEAEGLPSAPQEGEGWGGLRGGSQTTAHTTHMTPTHPHTLTNPHTHTYTYKPVIKACKWQGKLVISHLQLNLFTLWKLIYSFCIVTYCLTPTNTSYIQNLLHYNDFNIKITMVICYLLGLQQNFWSHYSNELRFASVGMPELQHKTLAHSHFHKGASYGFASLGETSVTL